jgi:hypothetical protein
MARLLLVSILISHLVTPAHAGSAAADYLVGEQLALACEGPGGRIDSSAVIERDLTGDGRDDLIISHAGITCDGGAGRSLHCGIQVCAFKVYVRRGQLLELARDMLGQQVRVEGGPVPTILWYGHGGGAHSLRWNGRAFE